MLKQCPSHGEKLTMFCSKNSSMLCMKCFSEASLETRLHCVDIDIAYEQRKKSLDLAISVSIDCSDQGSMKKIMSTLCLCGTF